MKFLSFLLNGQAKFGTYNKKYITDLTGKIKGALTYPVILFIVGFE